MTRATATPKKRRWTIQDDAQLTEMRAQGKSDRELSIALSRTEEAVRARRHGLRQQVQDTAAPHPQQVEQAPEPELDEADQTTVYANGNTWTPQDDAQLAELRTLGHDDHGIALLTGRTVAAVQARISNLRARGEGNDIPSRKRPTQWTPGRVAEARALRAEGMTMHQIARCMGTDSATVSRALRSSESVEDSPGEGVRVARTVPDLGRAESDVENARAALARAEARHREAMEPLLVAMRDAIQRAGLVPGPEEDDTDDGWPEPARIVVDLLRGHGIDLRVRT